MSGYEASEGSEFFRTLERVSEQQGATLPSWQSTHPDPGEREGNIQQLAAEWAGRPGIEMTEVDRVTYLQQLEGVVLGNNPRNGFTRDGTFYHPDLRFRFPVPGGWQVANQNRQVILSESNGQAVMVLTIAEANSLEEAAQQFAGQQGLTNVEVASATSQGIPARAVAASAQLQNGQNIRLLNYFLDYGGNVYSIMGLTTPDAYSGYRPTFLQTMQGFGQLTDRSILNIEPTRLRLVETNRAAPFRAFLPSSIPGDLSAEDLAILNQVELDEEIPAGTLLKMPTE
jgi:predicted Zn-dependent protease